MYTKQSRFFPVNYWKSVNKQKRCPIITNYHLFNQYTVAIVCLLRILTSYKSIINMPQNEEEITHYSSSLSVSPQFSSSSQSELNEFILEQDSNTGLELDLTFLALFGDSNATLALPNTEPTLKDILANQIEDEDINSLTEVRLQIISNDICLQHLSIYAPKLKVLSLDDSVIISLRELGSGLINLKVLYVNRCGLLSLDGIGGFEKLEELHASFNKINDLSSCTSLKNIRIIDLKRNFIKNINNLSYLSLCETLQHLTISENENITSRADYQSIIGKILPGLQTIDGKAVDSKICNHSDKLIKKCYKREVTPRRPRHKIANESPFVVSFLPKVLSPRPSSESSSSSDIVLSQ